jgi:hypothetical protein
MNTIYKYCENNMFFILSILYLIVATGFWMIADTAMLWSITTLLIVGMLALLHLAIEEQREKRS